MNHKTSFMLLVLSALVFGILTPSLSFSSWDLKSDFYLNVPSTFIDQQIDKIFPNQFSLTVPIADQTFYDVFDIGVSGISAQISSTGDGVRVIQSGEAWQVALPALSGEINIGSIGVSQTIQQVIGGIIVNITLNAQCSGIKLKLNQGGAAASGVIGINIGEGNQLNFSLNQFLMNWNPQSWTIQPFTCSGAQGFGDQVAGKLNQILASPTQFQSVIQAYIQNYLNQKIQSVLTQVFQNISVDTGRSDVLINLQPQAMQTSIARDGYQVFGSLHVVFPNSQPGLTVQESMPPITQPTSLETTPYSYITLPDGIIEKILSHIQDTNLLQLPFYTSQFPSMQSFMKSRFLEFFVFTDLTNYSRTANFAFQTFTRAPVSFQLSQKSGPVTGHFSGDFHVAMYAPVNNAYVNYIDFEAPTSSNISITLSGGKINFAMNQTNMSLHAHWDDTYVASHHPNKNIWTSAIASHIARILSSSVYSFALPTINTGRGTPTLDVVDFQHDANHGTLNFYLDTK